MSRKSILSNSRGTFSERSILAWDETAPDGLKVTIRETDRGDTVETGALYDENFGGFGDKGLDGAYTPRFRAKRKRPPALVITALRFDCSGAATL